MDGIHAAHDGVKVLPEPIQGPQAIEDRVQPFKPCHAGGNAGPCPQPSDRRTGQRGRDLMKTQALDQEAMPQEQVPEPASYPFLDALTTVMSFTATWLMAQKRVECWYYWIAVDLIGIVLYAVKGVRFIALLYVVFLFMAAAGLLGWKREFRRGRAGNEPAPARAV